MIATVMGAMCAGAWGENYWRWNRGDGTWGPGAADKYWQDSNLGVSWGDANTSDYPNGTTHIVYFRDNNGGSSITVTLTADITVKELYIGSDKEGANIIINLNGHNLNVETLYYGNISTTVNQKTSFTVTGSGTFTSSTVKAPNNSDKVSLEIGEDATFEGTPPSSVKVSGDGNLSNSNKGTYTISISPNLRANTESTVYLTSTVAFTKAYLDLTVTNNTATTAEEYTIKYTDNGVAQTLTKSATDNAIELDFGTSALTQTFTITLPAAIDADDGLSFRILDGVYKSFLKSYSYTKSAAAYVWTGSAGDGAWETPGNWDQNTVPTSAGDDVVIPENATVTISTAPAVGSIELGKDSTLNIGGNFTIDSSNAGMIIAPDAGTANLSITGTLTVSSNFDTTEGTAKAGLNITAGGLSTSDGGLKGNQITINGASTLGAGTSYIVSTKGNTTTLAGDVTVNGYNVPLAGNIAITGTVTVSSTKLLNHVAEDGEASWSSSAIVLENGAAFSMQNGCSYNFAAATGASSILITGTGSVSGVDTSNSSSVNVHFGNGDGSYAETITLAGDIELANVTIDDSCAELTGSGKTLTITNSLTKSSTQIDAIGVNLVFNSDATLPSGITTYADVEFKDNGTISGDNTFANLKASTAGKTITVTGTQTITDTLTLTGASGNLLNVTGSGTLSPTSLSAEYLSIDNTVKLSGFPTTFIDNSKPSAGTTDDDYLTVVKNGWYIKSLTGFTYKWKTDAGTTAWATPANWDVEIVPPAGATVEIQAGTNQPELSAAVNLASLTIDSSASLTLSGKDLTVTSAYSNSGTVVSAGSETVSMPSGYTTESGTWSFTAGNILNITNLTYNDISIDGTVEQNSDVSCQGFANNRTFTGSANTLTINGAYTGVGSFTGSSGDVTIVGAYSGTGTFTASSGNTTFKGDADLSSGTFTHNSGTVVFDGTTNLTMGSDALNNISITSTGSLILNSDISVDGTWSNSGTFDANSKKVTFNNDITISDATTFADVDFDGDATISGASSFGNTTFDGNVTLSAANTFTSFTVDASGKTVTVNAEQTVTTLSLKGASGSLLSVTGTGAFITATQTGGDYLSIDSTVKVISASGATADGVGSVYYTATNSVPTAGTGNADYAAVIRNGWRIKDLSALTYTWKTNAGTTAWATADNWDILITPVTGSAVEIKSGTNQPELSAAVNLASLTIDSSASLTLSGKDLTVNSSYSNSGTVVSSGSETVSVPASTTDSGTWSFTAGNILNIANLTYNDISIDGAVGQNSDVTCKNFTNNSAFTGSANTLTIKGDYSGTGNFTASSGNTTFKGDADLSNGTFTHNSGTVIFDGTTSLTMGSAALNNISITGSLTLNSDISVDGTWSNSGTFTANSKKVTFNNDITISNANTFAEVEFKGDVTISANNTFGTFTAVTAGKTVSISGEQTVTTLSLKGSSGSLLSVTGTGAFITATQTGGDYLSIDSTVKVISASGATADGVGSVYYTATNSVPTAGTGNADYAAVIRNGWRIKDLSSLTYTWKTNAGSTAWATADNWDILIAPVAGSAVEIKSGTNQPVLSAAVSLDSLTIDSGASLTLSGKDLTVTSAYSNSGTVVSAGSETVSVPASTTDSGTWSFTAGNILNITNLTYNDISIDGSVGQNSDITCKNFTNNSAFTGSANTLTIQGDADLSNGTFTHNSGTVVFDGTTNLTMGSDALNNISITSTGSLTLNSDISVDGTWSNSGTFTANSKKVTFNNDITISNANTFAEVEFKGDVTISANNTFGTFTAVTAGKTVSISGEQTVTTLSLKGSSGSLLSVTGTGAFIITATQTGGDYLSIGSTVKVISASGATADGVDSVYYTATNSEPTAGTGNADYAAVIRNGWRIKDLSALTYTWKTDAGSTAWATADNWDILIAPVDSSTVKIQAGTNQPVLSAAVSLDSLTIASGASLTLSGKDLTVTSSYSNSGTVVSSGSETVSMPSGYTTESGTWSFTAGNILNITNLTYNDISIDGSVSQNSDITCQGFTNNKSINIGAHKLTVSSYTGTGDNKVSINGGTFTNSGVAATITTLEPGTAESTITAGTGVTVTNAITGGTGKLSVSGAVSLAGQLASLTVTNGTTTLSTNTTISTVSNNGTLAVGTNALTINTTYSGTGSLTVGSGSVTFGSSITSSPTITSADVSGGTITNSSSSQTVTISSLKPTTATLAGGKGIIVSALDSAASATINTSGEVSLNGSLGSLNITGGTTTLNGTSTITNVTNGGTLAVAANTLTINTTYSGAGSLTVGSGSVTFGSSITSSPTITSADVSGGTITNSSSSQTVTISSLKPTTATLTGGKGIIVSALDSAASATINTSGAVSLNGTLGTLNITGGTTTLNGASTITNVTNGGTLAVAANTLTINTTYSGAGSLTVGTGSVTFGSGITSSPTITSADISGGTITNSSSSQTVTISSLKPTTATLAGGKGIIVSALDSAASATINTSGEVSLNGSLGSLNITGGTTTLNGTSTISTVSNNSTLDIADKSLSVSSYSGTTDIVKINGGTFTNSGAAATITTLEPGAVESTITAGNGVTITNAITGGTGKLSVSGTVSLAGQLDSLTVAGTLSLSGKLTAGSVTIAATTGSISAGTNEIEVSGNWTNNRGSAGLTSSGSVTFKPASTSNISGDTTFHTLKCESAGGKTLSFANGSTTTVTNTLTLKGSSKDSKLTLTSPAAATPIWTLDATGATTTLKWLSVENSTATVALTPLESADNGNNVNWNFPGQEYKWTPENNSTDADRTQWSNRLNWTPKSIPGKGSKITIENGKTKYPVLGSDVNVQKVSGTTVDNIVTINSAASLDLNEKSFSCDTLNLAGTIKIKGSEVPTATTKNFNDGYVLDYYSTGTFNSTAATFVSGGVKPDIKLSGTTLSVTAAMDADTFTNGGTTTLTANLTANNVNNNSTIAIGANTLTVNTKYTGSNDTITLAGGTFKNSSSANDATIGTITLTSESTVWGENKAVIVTPTAGDLKTKGTVKLSGTLANLTVVDGTTTTTAATSITTKLTNSGTFTTSADHTLTAAEISNTGTLNLNGTDSITAYSDTSATSKVNISKQATFTNATTINSTTAITNNGQLIASNSLAITGPVTITGSVTAAGNLTTSGTTTLTGNATYKTTAAASEIIFNNSINGDQILTLDSQKSITLKTASVNKIVFTDSTAASLDASATTIILNDAAITTTAPLTFPFSTSLSGTASSSITAPQVIFPGYATDITLDLTTLPLAINSYTLFNAALTGTGELTVTNDLILKDSEANGISLGAPVTVTGNLVAYNGNLQVSANVSVGKDLILLGATYDEKDPATNLDNIYYYNQSQTGARGLHPDKGNFAPAGGKLPDDSAAPVIPVTAPSATNHSFSASLQTSGSPTISVGQNFFANGVTASGNAAWNLKLKSNKNTTANFAHAYNCDFTASPCTVSCIDTGAATDAVAIAAENCTVQSGYEAGWDLDDFEIAEAYTVHDDYVYVRFNRAVSNLEQILSVNNNAADTHNINRITHSDGSYNAVYKDVAYSTVEAVELPAEETITTTDLAATDAVNAIFLKANLDDTWNTDATGYNKGLDSSTDTHGRAKIVIPHLDIQRNETGANAYNYFITDLYGKRLVNYHSDTVDYSTPNTAKGNTFTAVADKCSPVMISVKTGQELHTIYDKATGEASQHSYDSHNFIEFTYSEAVDFGSSDAAVCNVFMPALDSGAANIVENIRVTSQFGALKGDITTQGQLQFTGLGNIEDGLIYTGNHGTTDSTVNALYRDSVNAIRLSIAGYTDSTVADKNGNAFKNWIGYIEKAITPSGAYTLASNSTLNPLVKDQAGNMQKTASVPVSVKYEIDDYADNSVPEKNVYGEWDISSPVFALTRLRPSTPWGNREFAEAVGTGSGSTLDKIEFHLFDNTPAFNVAEDIAVWFTQKGWCFEPASHTDEPVLYDATYTYCADIIGGARDYSTTEENRTTGGIRFSTKAENPAAFKYAVGKSASPDGAFVNNISGVYSTVTSSIFTGSSSPRRAADDPDGLYMGLGLPELNLPVETTFTVSYDETTGYLTDLAGNRLRSDIISTIDRTPPSIDLSLSPINQDEIFVIFVKELITDSSKLMYFDENGSNIKISESFEALLPYCFDLISIGADGTPGTPDIQIDRSTPAKVQVYSNTENEDSASSSTFTFVTLKLTRNLTLKDIQSLYFRLTYPEQYSETSLDPVTSIKNSRVTLIQDAIGNYVQMYTAHALSDFLIGGIAPMYAYDAAMTYEDQPIMDGLYEEGSWAVHDWEVDQQNYGTLPAKHPIAIAASLDDGTSEQNNLPATARVFLSNSPDAQAVASQFNMDFNQQLRVWLPSVTDGLFPGFALVNNTNYDQADSRLISSKLSDGLIFDISEDITSKWESGDQISFLFGLTNADGSPYRIYSSPYYNVSSNKYDLSKSTALPLYAMRLHDPADILSLDLWSFKVRSITNQRGGVTILNNVINASKGEKTVVKVNNPSEGKINVMVMTLDGNIVKYLAHGQTTAGEHYYSWDGKNKNGHQVARGMYFVRVVGNGFDETRKVMVVK